MWHIIEAEIKNAGMKTWGPYILGFLGLLVIVVWAYLRPWDIQEAYDEFLLQFIMLWAYLLPQTAAMTSMSMKFERKKQDAFFYSLPLSPSVLARTHITIVVLIHIFSLLYLLVFCVLLKLAGGPSLSFFAVALSGFFLWGSSNMLLLKYPRSILAKPIFLQIGIALPWIVLYIWGIKHMPDMIHIAMNWVFSLNGAIVTHTVAVLFFLLSYPLLKKYRPV